VPAVRQAQTATNRLTCQRPLFQIAHLGHSADAQRHDAVFAAMGYSVNVHLRKRDFAQTRECGIAQNFTTPVTSLQELQHEEALWTARRRNFDDVPLSEASARRADRV
jgi:hypothetical protein